MSAKGKVSGVNGNMITVDVSDKIAMNEVGYVLSGGKRLKSEVIRINHQRNDSANADLRNFRRY